MFVIWPLKRSNFELRLLIIMALMTVAELGVYGIQGHWGLGFFLLLSILCCYGWIFNLPYLQCIENLHGKWIFSYSNACRLEINQIKILYLSKYTMVLWGRLLSSQSKLWVIYYDQFQYDDESELRWYLKYQ